MNDKQVIIAALKKLISEQIDIMLEIPPDSQMGDFAFPCFALAKIRKKSPQLIAHDLAAAVHALDIAEKVVAIGPYVNFFLNKKALAETILKTIAQQKDKYGMQKQKQRIMVEFCSPNTNKPLHLGHVRNIALGDSASRIFSFMGNYVIKACLINDRGVHICKSMLAYKKWGHNKNPDCKGDFFVGKYYQLFAQKAAEDPKLEEQAQELLRQWELGTEDVVELWKKMNQWVYDGFEKTYAALGVSFDKHYYESDIYTFGKELVLDGLKRGIFVKKEGAIVVLLEDVELPDKVLIRSDGTAIYMTQDLYLAQKKVHDFALDRSIYVVGSEQNMHFQQLFAILKKLGYIKTMSTSSTLSKLNYVQEWADACYHLSYGMVLLPEGKMKSREGKVVDADTIIEEMISLAKKEILKRHQELEHAVLENRARQVGLAALKFYLLKIDPVKDMVYHPEESISFEGETGPYVQYTHARIASILRKYGKDVPNIVDFTVLNEKEFHLTSLLAQFPCIVEESAVQYKPSHLCRYLLDLCQASNSYYHDVPVLKADKKVSEARLYLIAAVKQVLRNGLELLGIEAPEEM